MITEKKLKNYPSGPLASGPSPLFRGEVLGIIYKESIPPIFEGEN